MDLYKNIFSLVAFLILLGAIFATSDVDSISFVPTYSSGHCGDTLVSGDVITEVVNISVAHSGDSIYNATIKLLNTTQSDFIINQVLSNPENLTCTKQSDYVIECVNSTDSGLVSAVPLNISLNMSINRSSLCSLDKVFTYTFEINLTNKTSIINGSSDVLQLDAQKPYFAGQINILTQYPNVSYYNGSVYYIKGGYNASIASDDAFSGIASCNYTINASGQPVVWALSTYNGTHCVVSDISFGSETEHLLSFRVRDKAFNFNESSAVTLVEDVSPPTIDFVSPVLTYVGSGKLLKVNVTFVDKGSGVNTSSVLITNNESLPFVGSTQCTSGAGVVYCNNSIDTSGFAGMLNISASIKDNVQNANLSSVVVKVLHVRVDNITDQDNNVQSLVGLATNWVKLKVNATNNTQIGVNITHKGICLGQDNVPMQYNDTTGLWEYNCSLNHSAMVSGEQNVSVFVYPLVDENAINDTRNFTINYDDQRPVVVFDWWDTEDIDGSSVRIPSPLSILSNPDFFFSPNDNEIWFAVNVTDNIGIDRVVVNLSSINMSNPGNTCYGLLDLTYNSTTSLWEGNCSLGVFNESDLNRNDPYGGPLQSSDIIISVYDTAGNENWFYNSSGTETSSIQSVCPYGINPQDYPECLQPFIPVIIHDLGTPNSLDPCMHFGPETTNFNNVLNFSSVNLVLEIQLNMSCFDPSLPSDFITMNKFEFQSLDFFDQQTVAKMSLLPSALQVNITPPGMFGDSRIYINSTLFSELNTNSTITLYHLPFISMPTIVADPGARGYNQTSISWVSGYDPIFGVWTGNLTFKVYGFSGYNITDNTPPTIEFNYPLNNTKYMPPVNNVNVTINGTGTPLSFVNITLDTASYIYNATSDVNTANCTSANNETFYCNLTDLGIESGTHTVRVVAYDYGGEYPGNNNSSEISFSIDSIPPTISNISVSNITNSSTAIIFSTNELSTCFVKFGESSSLGELTPSIQNTTFSINLVGLNSSVLYYYSVNCTDLAGNSVESSISNFTTAESVYETLDNSSTNYVTINVTQNGVVYKLVEFELNVKESTSASINVTKYSSNPESVGLGVNSLNKYISIDSNLNSSKIDYVIIKVYYTDSEVPEGVDESSLRLYWFNESSNEWERVPGGVDTVNNYVWGNTTHFSTYGIGGLLANGQSCSSNSECASGICCEGLCSSTCGAEAETGGAGAGVDLDSYFWFFKSNVQAGETVDIDVNKPENPIGSIKIRFGTSVDNIRINILKLHYKPMGLPDLLDVYSYISILHSGLEEQNIEKAEINFKVDKRWLLDRGYDKLGIVLARYEKGEWTDLSTDFVKEDSDYYYYKAETPGFSYFAIRYEEPEGVEEQPRPTVVEPTGPTKEEEESAKQPVKNVTEQVVSEEKKHNYVYTVILILLIVLISAFLFAIKGRFLAKGRR